MLLRIFIILEGLFLCLSSYGQTYLTGQITNESGIELPSANILLDNGTGTTTDLFGKFTIDINGADTLIVSHIGFEKTTHVLSDIESPYIIKLTSSSVQLADVEIMANQATTLKHISTYDIKQRPIQTSQDVLRIIPGLFIAQHAGGGKAEQIFLRGFDIDHGTDIALSVDGMPVNMVSHAHGQGYSDLHFVIPETIEKVEFNKGTYNASKGDFTTAGYADFSIKEKLDNSSIKAEGGQFGTFRTVTMLDLSPKIKNTSAYVAGEVFLSDGYFESPQGFSRINLIGKYTTKVMDNTKISASFSTFRSNWDASGQIPVRAVENGSISRYGAIDDTEGGETSRTNLNLIQKTSLSSTEFITNQLYISDYDFNLISNFTFFLNNPVNGDQITQSENRKIYGYSGTYMKDWFLGSSNLTTTIGGGLRYDDVNEIRLSRTANRRTIIEDLAYGDIDQQNLNLFLEQSLSLGNLKLSAGLRYDYFNFSYIDRLSATYENQTESAYIFSPKVSADYKINNRLSLFAKAGSGFHSNDARVVVAQSGEDILPRAVGTDLGFVIKPLPHLIVTTTAWHLNLEQEFVYVGDEGIVEPGGETNRKGIDLSVRYQLTDWLFADTDLNYTDPKALNSPEGEDYIPLAPTFTSIGGLGFDFDNGLKGSLRYRYLADRAANEDNSVIAEGYYLLDATIAYTKPKFEIGLVVENVLDRQWKEAQFETESRLFNEPESVSEIHFTPGSPFFAKLGVTVFF